MIDGPPPKTCSKWKSRFVQWNQYSDLDSFGGSGVKLQNPGVRLIGERLDEESKPLQTPNYYGLGQMQVP